MNINFLRTTRLLSYIGLALMLVAAIGCGSRELPQENAGATTATTAPAATTANTKPAETGPAVRPADETKAAEKSDVVGPTPAAAPVIAPPTNPPTLTTPASTIPIAVPSTESPTAATGTTKVTVSTTVEKQVDYSSLLFVFMLATFIGLGVILRVSRLLHTPLMSITNAISAIAVVGSIMVVGEEGNPWGIRLLGAIALFASMTNIVSGFLITDRMLKMFKTPPAGGKR
ncbi:MAG TPA: NAD(P) transhydrogenase subunit alpha [Pirellulales bacterium]|jgi:NAD(P) transhydrogenase subunit alpha